MRQVTLTERSRGRPEPDEVELEELPSREWLAIAKRAGKDMVDDNMLIFASALAYSSFLAIPSVLLVVVGLFTLIAGPATITSLIDSFGHVMPSQATQLIGQTLHRLDQRPGTSIAMTVVGLVLAVWAVTGAMTSYMAALNVAYECKDSRGFVAKRTIAIAMAACIAFAFLLVAALLMFGPQLERLVASLTGARTLVGYLWWVVQWPILVLGLLAAFATMLYLGPDLAPGSRRWKLITPGAVVAVVLWLLLSGLFAVYTARFGSYNKAWGSLSAVIVMLTWLWLSALALLLGAEINAEIRRSTGRRSRSGASSNSRRAEANLAS
jgi:membrane protein